MQRRWAPAPPLLPRRCLMLRQRRRREQEDGYGLSAAVFTHQPTEPAIGRVQRQFIAQLSVFIGGASSPALSQNQLNYGHDRFKKAAVMLRTVFVATHIGGERLIFQALLHHTHHRRQQLARRHLLTYVTRAYKDGRCLPSSVTSHNQTDTLREQSPLYYY